MKLILEESSVAEALTFWAEQKLKLDGDEFVSNVVLRHDEMGFVEATIIISPIPEE